MSAACAPPVPATTGVGAWADRLAALLAGPKALRVDVQPHPDVLHGELEECYRRMSRPGDTLFGLPAIPIEFPGLVFRYREADGEHYVYAVDAARGRMAGYTVFNRLVEIHKHADRHLRAPHSRYASDYQRRGIATAVYRWWLDGGNCLISGARQSAGAHALWLSLGAAYALTYVQLQSKRLRYLGPRVDARVREDLHTRMVLAGAGWDTGRLAAFIDMPARR